MSNILDSFQCLNTAIPEELLNSTEKILKYANISKERAQIFQINLDYFRNLKDKTEFDSNSKRIIEMINSDFFEIYYSVLRRVMAENNHSPLYQMFLCYAYMDEK
ncbi:MAG: hypothetical protein PHC92_09500, partial [Syntrophomonadaceae bacterium]|nr:hypothetical protein [Syntrophomonadaceae bacterium]